MDFALPAKPIPIGQQDWPAEWFTEEEFSCEHCGLVPELNEWTRPYLQFIDGLRMAVNRPLVMVSSFRCLNHPIEKKKGHDCGSHPTGCAGDFIPHSTEDIFYLTEHSMVIAKHRGVLHHMGLGPTWRKRKKGERKTHFHLDVSGHRPPRSRPGLWTY